MTKGLDNSVQYLKGVGPRRASFLKRLGVATVEDLLYYFPRKYLDRRTFTPIAALREETWSTIRGKVLASVLLGRPRKKIFRLVVADGTGKVACTWFNQPYLQDKFRAGEEVIFSGKVQRYGFLQMVNPEYEKISDQEGELIHTGRIIPIYPLTEGLNQKTLRTIIKQSLDEYAPWLTDMFPEELRARWQVIPFSQALKDIHYPTDYAALQESRKRLILDEFFLLQLGLAIKRKNQAQQALSLPHSPETPLLGEFIRTLPFKLTRAQLRVIGEIKKDMTGPVTMNRLLQGDVGSGKTVVAVCALLVTVSNGYQGAVMVPTEILAAQHDQNLRRMLDPLGLRIVRLTGGVRGKEKEERLQEIEAGRIQIVVGTQAMIQENVRFSQLGLVVIDEQHKFGVLERAELIKKGWHPHVLVMTATPIPRTLTMTVYGDLDVSVLDEMPPGRKKVKTFWIGPDKLAQAYGFIRRQVDQGKQVFIIYPLIEESEALELKAAREMFDRLRGQVFPQLNLGLIHGRMSSLEKEKVMREFQERKIQILVSTVVVEIGIDIPNATVLLVENAERFGLAQLHQLRGRIGRGEHQSYFILQGNPQTEAARRRLQAMRTIDDGFLIAQEDLDIRGPGEFFGTRQHGLPEIRIGSIVADVRLMEFARRQAFRILEDDPQLNNPRIAAIRERLLARYCDKLELGAIG